VSEPVPCPTCQSLLRLPPGATAVRCPNCKTVLAVEPADAPAPAPAAPAAPPLPFGRPRPAAPLPPAPPARPIPTTPPKRAKLAPEPTPYARPGQEETAVEIDPDEKLKRMRRELAKLDEEERREQEWMRELSGHCKHGRTALYFLTWGMRSYAVAVLFQFAAVAAVLFNLYAYAALAGLACLPFAGFTTLLLCIGFGFAIAGPRQSRHIGVMGLVITIVHAIGGVLQPGNLAIMARLQGIDTPGKPMWSDVLVVQDMLGLATNLPLLADHPARFVQRYNWSLPGLIVAALEFTRLVLVCMLAEQYASAGKDPEAGHRAFKWVTHTSLAVMLMGSFRLAAAALFDWGQFGDMWFVVGQIVHGGITGGMYTGMAVGMLLISRTLSESIDVVDPRRFADNRERLEL
jgi:LSD1 subclass zinc finger protein